MNPRRMILEPSLVLGLEERPDLVAELRERICRWRLGFQLVEEKGKHQRTRSRKRRKVGRRTR
ncbi:hypothetical protein COLO4_07131 [Corchorus olitorius]|uniref:Uncharacterized protein n=1 Tax=Corchorus olitorius TaxID=93759 RepID=A0A1R3KKT2_9ROSI|nr:hypothetical protein COLO4_07131 [Corchorus olitorius]